MRHREPAEHQPRDVGARRAQHLLVDALLLLRVELLAWRHRAARRPSGSSCAPPAIEHGVRGTDWLLAVEAAAIVIVIIPPLDASERTYLSGSSSRISTSDVDLHGVDVPLQRRLDAERLQRVELLAADRLAGGGQDFRRFAVLGRAVRRPLPPSASTTRAARFEFSCVRNLVTMSWSTATAGRNLRPCGSRRTDDRGSDRRESLSRGKEIVKDVKPAGAGRISPEIAC